MSEENIETLRRVYDSFNRGEFDAAASIVHPEVEMYPAGEQPPYRGRASLRQWMEPDAFVDQTLEPLEFTSSGNKVLVKQRVQARGAASGMEIDDIAWVVCTFDDDGLLARIEGYLDREEAAARQAAGLSE